MASDYRSVVIAGESERVPAQVIQEADLVVRTRAEGTWRVEKDRYHKTFGPVPFDGLPREIKAAIIACRRA